MFKPFPKVYPRRENLRRKLDFDCCFWSAQTCIASFAFLPACPIKMKKSAEVASNFLFSAHIYNMEGKPSTQRVHLFTFTSQLKASECLDDSEFEKFLSSNYSKFAVKCE